jgi:hypothetical protein
LPSSYLRLALGVLRNTVVKVPIARLEAGWVGLTFCLAALSGILGFAWRRWRIGLIGIGG